MTASQGDKVSADRWVEETRRREAAAGGKSAYLALLRRFGSQGPATRWDRGPGTAIRECSELNSFEAPLGL